MSLLSNIFPDPNSALLFSTTVLLWSLCNYLIGNDLVPELSATGRETLVRLKEHPDWIAMITARAILSALIAGAISGWQSAYPMALVFSASLLLPLGRAKISAVYIPELELASNLIFVLALAGLIGRSSLTIRCAPILLRFWLRRKD